MHIPPPRTPADGQSRSVATDVPGPPAYWRVDDDPASDLGGSFGGPSAAGSVVEPGPPHAGEGHDLAAHRPGQAAAEVAAELRAAAPVGSFLARLFGLHTRERAWRVGAAGERITARYLRRLTDPWWARLAGQVPRWHVLHAVPIGTRGADIDHVVLGPAGVVTVNTKHHPGATVWVGDRVVMVNGTATSYARKAFAEAARAARLLTAAAGGEPVPVRPVIAVVGARVTGRRQTRDGVLVVPAQQLSRALRRGHRTLSDQRVHELYAVARRSETWRG
ncbi:NERD domain-containing protein [Pseudonocardia bannensis]|uniref:NERD domain-containing protein n=2 Tax=Pseudonocardia bannensis TaxID=630973 RepID=A0A848DL68_9PSEU|nr:NERD domain-containing protein [Pseudonocardia bannensis]